MSGPELRRIFPVSFPCPHCGTGNNAAAGWVIEHDVLPCQNCSRNIDLSGSEWLTFRRTLDLALQGLQPHYDRMPQLTHCEPVQRTGR
jgi:hypothetical protein